MVLTLWTIREKGEIYNPDELYAAEPTFFSLKIHHGGIFTKKPGRRYVDGKANFVDLIDIDAFSIHELKYMVEELGCSDKGPRYCHFLIPGLSLDHGLCALGSDMDVNALSKHTMKNKLICVYIEHGLTTVDTYFKIPKTSNVIIQELEDKGNDNELPHGGPSNMLMLELPHYTVSMDNVEVNVEPLSVDKSNKVQVDISEYFDDDFNPFLDDNLDHMANVNTEKGKSKEGGKGLDANVDEGLEGEVDEDDQEDGDYIGDEDNNVAHVEVDMTDFNCNIDQEAEFMGTNKETQKSRSEILEVNEEVLDNDIFESGDESDANEAEKIRKRKLKEIKKQSHLSNESINKSMFYVSQTFASKKQVKEHIKKHAIETRRQIKIVKNDKSRIRAVCEGTIPTYEDESSGSSLKGNNVNSHGCEESAARNHVGGRGKKGHNYNFSCPWVVHVSKLMDCETWMVKTFKEVHECLQSRQIKACTSAFLGTEIADQLETNPQIPIRSIQEQMQKKLEIGVSKMKAYRAKVHASTQVQGDYQSQYKILRDYCMELQSRNEGTTCKIEVEEENTDGDTRVFSRIYICLGALKKGFRALGRELLGLDGAFMKGPYPGILLTAVGLDSNNGIYPLAYAIVEAETYKSWKWFLTCLGGDLGLEERSNFTFVSDRQKGILPAIADVFPCAEHRYCVRHIHENLKLQWKGAAYKELLWKCATTTTMQNFSNSMQELRSFNEKTYQWLAKIPPIHWSRAHFSGRAVSDVLLNNMCEVFNRQLVEARDKPIITALEYIREYLMKRIVNVCMLIEKVNGPLTPSATKLFEKVKSEASKYNVLWNGGSKHQVTGPWADQCVVDIAEKTCACRRWEITGFPCKHAVAAIWNMGQNGQNVGVPESYVHQVYWLDTWKKVYAFKIDPINGMSMWPKSNVPTTLLPPKHRTPVGRPKKKRIRGVDENASMVDGGKLSRRMKTVTCSKCKNAGHNAKGCKGQGGSQSTL